MVPMDIRYIELIQLATTLKLEDWLSFGYTVVVHLSATQWEIVTDLLDLLGFLDALDLGITP